VSKRNQSSRRKAYGRRQHELRERTDRYVMPELLDASWLESPQPAADGSWFLDARRSRVALGD
jgi:hypothetical protein